MIELYLKIQIKEIFQLLQESAILPPVSNYIPMIIDLLGTFLTVLQNIGMFSHFQMPAICFQLRHKLSALFRIVAEMFVALMFLHEKRVMRLVVN